VVLNDAAAPAGAKQWAPAELKKIETMLAAGLGVNAERGDRLSVTPLPFPSRPAVEPWYEQKDTLIDLGGYVGYGAALLLGYLLIARPALRLARQALVPAAAAPAIAPATAITPLEPLIESQPAPATPALGSDARATMPVVPLLENFELPPPGSPVDVLVDHLKVLAAKEPERVAEVVKQWVQKKVTTA